MPDKNSADKIGIPIGRFVARVVRPGALLYLGTNRTFTREPRGYEAGHTIIEIYDSRYPHTPLGQFVSSYGAEAVADLTSDHRLSLQGGIEAWTMTFEESGALGDLARSLLDDK